MPDNKLTDNEIIQALDICSKSTNGCSHSKYTCKDCYLNGQPMCSSVLLHDAIEHFNRLQAENERLEAECEEQYESAEATIRAEIASGGTSCHWCEDKVRIEAYKECIEKAKEEIYQQPHSKGMEETRERYRIMQILDNLLKELVDNNG